MMGGGYNHRHLGMIRTSPSWRRHWVQWRLARYPAARLNSAGDALVSPVEK